MIRADFDLTVRLIIKSAESLDFTTKLLGIEPTPLPKSATGIDLSNIWVLQKHYERQQDISESIHDFFLTIPDFETRISKMKAYGECAIRISIITEFGQFGFALKPNDIQLLNRLCIPFEVSVFSFGNCIEESPPNQ